jgi:hypothetical protein
MARRDPAVTAPNPCRTDVEEANLQMYDTAPEAV